MRLPIPAFLAFATLFATVPASAADKTLTIYTYESFTAEWGPGPKVKAAFEAQCGCTLEFVSLADGVALLTRLKAEGSANRADIVLGLDNSLLTEAKATGLFADHGIDTSAAAIPGGFSDPVFVPYDYGHFAVVYDSETVKNPPKSLKELVDGDPDQKIVLQDPRSSTPGLGFLVWMKAVYGDQAKDAWVKLNKRVLTVTPGWSEAYGLFTKGEADMVLSYSTSPAYHIIAENNQRYKAAEFSEGHPLQIEVAGIVKASDDPELARQFLGFMLSPAFQDIIPENNWMLPAAAMSGPVNPVFDQLIKPKTIGIAPDTVAANRAAWIDEWLAASGGNKPMMIADPDRGWKLVAGFGLFVLLVAIVAGSAFGLALTATGPTSLPPVDWLVSILRFTALQAVLSTVLSVSLAIPVARALARQSRFAGRRFLLQLMAIPLSLPVLVGAFAIIGIWGRRGFINESLTGLGLIDQPVSIYGLTGILIAHVFFNLPLSARLMVQALERIPAEQFKLSASLGMGRWTQFRLVEWPAVARVIPGMAALVFMLCATSFTLVLVLGGGPQATTLEVAIYQSLRLDYDPARAALLSVLQIALSAAAWFAVSRLRTTIDPGHSLSRMNADRFDGRTWQPRLTDAVILILFALFVLTPLAQIVVSGLGADLLTLSASKAVQDALVLSLVLSLTSGVLTILVALCLLEASRMLGPRHPALARLLVLAPGTTLLIPVLALSTGWFVLLTISGLVAPLRPVCVIVLNVMMALPFAVSVLEAALASHHIRHDRLAANLGLTGTARLARLDWPVMKRPVLAAMSFAFALSLGDLGVVALFGSDDFVTLPALIHARLGSYRSDDAAGLALILGALAVLMSLPAARLETASGS